MADAEAATIAGALEFSGRGVHTGQPAHVRILPAEAGIHFRRTDVRGARVWRVSPGNAAVLPGRSQIGAGADAVQTPEHLLAALAGMGVDAAAIELDGPEVPIMDGSALPFAAAVRQVGLSPLGRPAAVYGIPTSLVVGDGAADIRAEPFGGLSICYRLEYEGIPAACGEAAFNITPDIFMDEIAPARTFVTEREAAAMLSAGLGKGADAGNTLLLGADGPAGGAAFRLPMEPVRHKILDLVGDLALLGGRLEARLYARRSGHALNHRLLEKIAMSAVFRRHSDGVSGELDIDGIERMLPHRYPFLLIDRVIEADGEERLVAIKNVSRNEPYFEGHFPGRAVMPGVLQIEAMAQAAGVLLMHYHPDPENAMAAIVGMDQVRFRRPVEPGDQLVITVTKEKVTRRLGIVRGVGTVNGEVACEARLLFSVVPRKGPAAPDAEDA